MSHVWTMHARSERLDWIAIKDGISIEAVAVAMLGPPATSQGRRLLWRCPFHNDHNPSLVVDPDRGTWKCYPCDLGGDAVALVMKANGSTFPEAVRTVAEMCVLAPSSGTVRPMIPTRPARSPTRPIERPSGLSPSDASALVIEAAERFWSPDGVEHLEYLHSRGLTDETIRSARLGFVDAVAIPTRDGDRTYRASGISIPWFDGDRLVMVKIRQPDGMKPKYVQAFSDRPRVYPGPEAIRPGLPLVVAEGEFDVLLLHQQIGELASVLTLGGASSPLDPDIKRLTRGCSPLFVANDSDGAGDRAAGMWPARSIRVRPPEGSNDWTDVHKSGFNRIRYAWGSRLPMCSPWERLESQRWGSDDAPEDLGCVADEIGIL